MLESRLACGVRAAYFFHLLVFSLLYSSRRAPELGFRYVLPFFHFSTGFIIRLRSWGSLDHVVNSLFPPEKKKGGPPTVRVI